MGLAWVSDDAGAAAPSEPDRQWASQDVPGPRHRRPTLLARSGQAVVGRITALAGTHPAAAQLARQHAAARPRTSRSRP